MGLVFTSVPINSIMAIPAERRHDYLVAGMSTSDAVRQMLLSPRTGAYLRGLAKSHQLPEKTAVTIAFVVLQAAIGEVPVGKISALLASHLQLPLDRTQKLATELERDLFAPLALEIKQQKQAVQQTQATTAQSAATKAGARNVLNLKRQPPATVTRRPPTPPPLPPR